MPRETPITDAEVLARPPTPADAEIRYGTGAHAVADLRLPDSDRERPPGGWPVVVLVHGGCWSDIADRHYLDGLADALRAKGWATWSLGFRTLGSGGGWPATFLDVAAGTDHLREVAAEHAIDTGRVVAVGHSSGGHLALWLAARPRLPVRTPLHTPDPLPLRAVVGLAAIPDLAAFQALEDRACLGKVEALLGGDPDDRPGRLTSASPAELLPLGVPHLLLAGEADPDVPPVVAEAYAEKARRAGDRVRVEVIADAGHFELVAPWWKRWVGVERLLLDFLPPG